MKKTVYLADLRTVVRNRALAYEKLGATWAMDNAGELATGGAYVRRIFGLFVPGAKTGPSQAGSGATGAPGRDDQSRAVLQ